MDDGLALGARFGLDDTEGFDVSSEGAVTYWKPLGIGAAIWQYRNGVTTQRTPALIHRAI